MLGLDCAPDRPRGKAAAVAAAEGRLLRDGALRKVATPDCACTRFGLGLGWTVQARLRLHKVRVRVRVTVQAGAQTRE